MVAHGPGAVEHATETLESRDPASHELGRGVMDVVLTHGAGLAGHQQTVMACRVTPDPLGPQADGRMEGREFGTLTRDVLALSDGLTEAGSTPVALASSGESGTPVDTRREGPCPVFLVNAAPVKTVPGRQTDRADARWRAQRMRDG
jgi:transposase